MVLDGIDNGFIEGVDFSNTMVSVAMQKNRSHIEKQKVKIREGNFDEIPYNSNSFDKICSTNTIYFWANPEQTIQKIERLLKPQGKFVVAFEDMVQLKEKPISKDVFKLYSTGEVIALFMEAGFSGGVVLESREIGSSIYHCVVGRK